MPKDKDLDILRRRRSTQQRQTCDEMTSGRVPEAQPVPVIIPASGDANTQVSGSLRVSGTHSLLGESDRNVLVLVVNDKAVGSPHLWGPWWADVLESA